MREAVPGSLEIVSQMALPKTCLSAGERIHFKRKEVIFQMGEVPQKLYYIVSGKVRVVALSECAVRRILFYISQENFVGDVRFLAELPLSFQVESMTDIVMISFTRATVVDFLGSNAEFRRCLFLGIAQKMKRFGSEMVTTAYDDTRSRLMHTLCNLAVEKNGQLTVTMSQQELAEYMGVHRVTVNRILGRWQALHKVTVDREKIILHDTNDVSGL